MASAGLVFCGLNRGLFSACLYFYLRLESFVNLCNNNNDKFILWRQFNVKSTVAYIGYVLNSYAKASSEHYYGQHRVNRCRHAMQQQQRYGRRKTCSFWPLPASDVQHYVSQNDDYQPSSSRWWDILAHVHLDTCAPASPFCTVRGWWIIEFYVSERDIMETLTFFFILYSSAKWTLNS